MNSFQEIVPLNAGNVLVIEDNEPAARWLVLINQSLNRPDDNDTNVFQHPTSPSVDSTSSRASSSLDTSFSELTKTASGSTIFQKSSLKAIRKPFMPMQRKQLKACNCPTEMIKSSYRDACFRRPKKHANETDSSGEEEKENTRDSCGSVLNEVTSAPTARDQLKYNLIVCKQMVGIFVTVWVKKELVQHIGHLRTSCIGRGILGCLGNKVRIKSDWSNAVTNCPYPEYTSTAGMYISKHDSAPDKLLFHLQPFGFRSERRRRIQKKL